MTTPSRSSRHDRVRALLRIVVVRLARGGLCAIPGGSALDNVTFGIHESLLSNELKRQLDELIGQVRMLADERDANLADQRHARANLPAAAALEEFLTGLSDPDYREAEDQTLQILQSFDRWPDCTAEKLRLALDSIVLADEALRRQISQLRDIERLWVESLAGKDSLRAFITMSRSIRAALDIRDSGRDPIWYLDSSVLSDYLNGLDAWRGTVEPAVSRYLIRAARPNSLRIPGAQVGQLIHRFRFAVERAQAAADGRMKHAYSLAVSISEFMALPQDWTGGRPSLPDVEVLDQQEFTRVVAERLDQLMGRRFHESNRLRRLIALASAVAETRAQSERSGASEIAVLVARGERLLPSLERIAGEFPNCLVTHSYGPAWLCFLERESPAARALAAREISRAASSMDAATRSDLLDDADPQSCYGWEREVRKHIPQFLRAANEFHQAVAEEIDRFREEVMDAASAWTDSLFEGSELFSSLLAWVDSLPGADPSEQMPTHD